MTATPGTDSDAVPAPVESGAGGGGTDRSDVVYNVVIGLLYAVAVGVQAFLILDEVTHGKASDDLEEKWRELVGRWRARRSLDAQVRRYVPWVLWEAHQATTAAAEGDHE